MKLSILVESKMEPIPPEVKIVENYEYIQVLDDSGTFLVEGNHMILEAETEVIKKWLVPFDGVFLSAGNVMEQRFEAYHIKE